MVHEKERWWDSKSRQHTLHINRKSAVRKGLVDTEVTMTRNTSQIEKSIDKAAQKTQVEQGVEKNVTFKDLDES